MCTATSHHLGRHARTKLAQPHEPIESQFESRGVARRGHAEPYRLHTSAVSDGECVGRRDCDAGLSPPRNDLGTRPWFGKLEPSMISGAVGSPRPALKNTGSGRLSPPGFVAV